MSNEIIIVGSGFAGITAALELRRCLPAESLAVVTVVSASDDFTFLPSLIWVAQGSRELEDITFSARAVLEQAGIHFVRARLEKINRSEKTITLSDGQTLIYNKLLITTGGEWAWKTLPGLAPYPYGYIASILSPHDVLQARGLWQSLLAQPGPLVVGATAGAGLFGAAYEFALNADLALRELHLREQIPIVFLTPEPHLGHFGRGGFGNSQHMLEEVFARQGIAWFANAQVTDVKPHAVFTQENGRFESNFTMLVPPQRGIAAVRATAGLADTEGYIAIDDHYRSQADNDIYAAGAAISKLPVVPTPLPIRTFIPGTVSAQMGRLAAANIAAALGYGHSEAAAPESINSLYLMDTGAQGLFLSLGASSWINLQMSLPPALGHWAKEVTEKQQITRLKSGQY